MAKVFISYSRKDIEFAKRLTAELEKSELDFWVDWEGIPPTVDWWKEIEKGIEEADVFLFLISPDSAASKVCGQEIDHAVRNGKRIVPIVVREIDWEHTPPQIGHLNYIFFSRGDDFGTATAKLLTAIHTDFEWAAAHRRLQVKALEWERSGREGSYLLRGRDLQDAEFQLATNTSKDPHPTDLQREFVFTGRQAADRQRRITTGASLAAGVIMAFLAIFGFYQADVANENLNAAQTAQAEAVTNAEEANRQAQISRVGELAAQSISLSGKNIPVALLLSVESYKGTSNGEFNPLQAQSALFHNAQQSPHLIQYLYGHTDAVNEVAFSPDGSILATGGADASIIFWDVESRSPVGEPLRGHADAVSDIAFSPDGKSLVSSSHDGTLILWDVETRQPIGSPLKGHKDAVRSVAFSPDGKTLASGGSDRTIILWDVRTQKPVGLPINLENYFEPGFWGVLHVNSLEFSPDGTKLASDNWGIFLWDLETREPITRLTEFPSASIVFDPDGKRLAAGGGGSNDVITVWDLQTRERIDEFAFIHSGRMTSIAFSPDGRSLASGGEDNDIILWGVEEQAAIGEPWQGHNSPVLSLAFSPDGKTIASSSADGTVILWNVEEGNPIARQLGDTDIVSHVEFSPRRKWLIANATLWDVETSQPITRLQVGRSHLSIATFSPDEKTLAFGGNDNSIILWDVESQQPIEPALRGHKDLVYHVAFSSDGAILASASVDNTIMFWDMSTKQPIGEPLEVHLETEGNIAFNPDATVLALAGADNGIYLWDVETRQIIGKPLNGHKDRVTSISFSPDGTLLASGSWDRTIILWDVRTGQAIAQPLREHSGNINSLAFSPNGKVLASASSDTTIILWDVASLQLIAQLPVLSPNLFYSPDPLSLAFHPDGATLASGHWYSYIRLWDVDPASLAEKSCQRAGRNFTRAEWERYFPNEEYRKTCEQWPLNPEITP